MNTILRFAPGNAAAAGATGNATAKSSTLAANLATQAGAILDRDFPPRHAREPRTRSAAGGPPTGVAAS